MVENADFLCYFEHTALMEEGRQDNFLFQIPFFSLNIKDGFLKKSIIS